MPAIAPSSDKKEQALFLATLATALSLIPTAYVTFISNSVVLLGDFLRCVVEFLAIFLSWRVVRRIRRGDRTYFDFGLGKLEQLASLAIALSMFFTFLVVALSALHRVIQPVPVEGVELGMLLAGLSVGGNCLFWWYYHRLYTDKPSPVLDSQAKLFRAKAFASLVVLVSLLFVILPVPEWLKALSDPLGSLVLASFLLYSAVGMFSASIRDLLDGAVDEAVRLAVLKELVRYEQLYQHFLGIRTRRAGSTMHIELQLRFDGALPLYEVSERCRAIAGSLHTQFPGSEVLIIPNG